MPKLWNETIAAHRDAVRAATLDATADLVHRHGLASVTMTQVAEAVGIGRATLYKYFPDVDAIMAAWHERQVTGHLEQLAGIRHGAGNPAGRLKAVLEAYARISYQHHGTELAALLHHGGHISRAQQHLQDFIRDLIGETADAGDLRTDVSPEELAVYCLHALAAANTLSSQDAVHRLVAVIMSGLKFPEGATGNV
ncbi:TetR/AcrR family transcriptional regulator [Arthrobacter crystallopoietes]|uniref:DNA-binding transcriptional regulator, AcrR family n=1 Tax=Crystallibacter crystallopoietes TaxID=37928 RepID=A0A1H1FWE2_9MICC|nr:TetR/AcrR family transcriptional regulator [Arthrobacter crystallopoietes]AUI52884.1 TetR family transcriptional regulator [Arthrobacter crystallopoietes]SDR05261.1 DNA-binding transcriptional regulator, AcrR family [Arthrobacter crystallopoietes]